MNIELTDWQLDSEEGALVTDDLLGLGIAGAIVYAYDGDGWAAFILKEGYTPIGNHPTMLAAFAEAEAWALARATDLRATDRDPVTLDD